MMLRHEKTWTVLALACAATLALGGCGKGDSDQKQAASGELLPRSATDDMLPYDTVRSQPPLADPEAAATGAARGAGAITAASTEAAAAAEEAAREVISAEANDPATAPE